VRRVSPLRYRFGQSVYLGTWYQSCYCCPCCCCSFLVMVLVYGKDGFNQ